MRDMTLPEVVVNGEFLEAVLPRIRAAQKTIDVMVFDWRLRDTATDAPVQQLVACLYSAITRGVRVRVLTASEAVAAMLKRQDFKTRVVHTQKLLHTKIMLIDDTLLITGSHNYTESAFLRNIELSVICELNGKENRARLLFDNLWGI